MRRHRFFTDRLIEAGVDPKTAEADACRIEHVISDETFRRPERKNTKAKVKSNGAIRRSRGGECRCS